MASISYFIVKVEDSITLGELAEIQKILSRHNGKMKQIRVVELTLEEEKEILRGERWN